MKKRIGWIIGVDEAGRGPLAGPVAVGVAMVPAHFDWELIPGVGDSKKVSAKNREAIFRRAQKLKSSKVLDFHVALVSATIIDRIGIREAVQQGILRCLKVLSPDPEVVYVKLDGLLKAPAEFTYQETIIKGDAKEKTIGLASILAKVTRDTHMCKMAKKYPLYAFEVHKGYGTALHRAKIRQNGLSEAHRRSFTKNVLRGTKYEEKEFI